MEQFTQVLSRLAFLSLVALSFGCSSSGGDDDSTPVIDDQPDEVVETDAVTLNINGFVHLSPNNRLDSDRMVPVQDRVSSVFSSQNNTASAAQLIEPFGKWHGYISGYSGSYPKADPTDFFEVERQYNRDNLDFFRASLVEGQTITLKAISALGEDYPIDFLMYLRPVSNLVKLDAFAQVTSEDPVSIVVPHTKDYVLEVRVNGDRIGPLLYEFEISDPFDPSVELTIESNFVPGEVLVKFREPEPESEDGRDELVDEAPQEEQNEEDATAEEGEGGLSNVVARPNNGVGTGLSDNHELALQYVTPDGVSVFELIPSGSFGVSTSNTSDPASVELQKKRQTLEVIAELNQREDVEFAVPNTLYGSSSIDLTERLGETFWKAAEVPWNLAITEIDKAWATSEGEYSTANGAQRVRIAVIDSGVDHTHSDLAGNLAMADAYDFVTVAGNEGDEEPGIDSTPNDCNVEPDDCDYHGTRVSGIIVATENGHGIKGVAPKAEVVPIRALGVDGSGSATDLSQAIRYAAGLDSVAVDANGAEKVISRRADIINLSLGEAFDNPLVRSAIEDALEAGVIIVAAAGNSATTQLHYPAAYAGVISVGSIDANLGRSSFSNFGSQIDVVAPGGFIRLSEHDSFIDDCESESSVFHGILSTTGNDRHCFSVGTSFAAPVVSGIAALMKAVNQDLTSETILHTINNRAITDSLGNDVYFGNGLINAQKALAVADTPNILEGVVVEHRQSMPDVTDPDALTCEQLRNESNLSSLPYELPVIQFNATKLCMLHTISKTGNGAVEIEVRTEGDWISVEPIQVTSEGIGTYLVSVDQSLLPQTESDVGHVTFVAKNITQPDQIFDLTVYAMEDFNINDTIGEIILDLIDANGNVVSTQIISSVESGVESGVDPDADTENEADTNPGIFFEFEDLDEGQYQIVARTDLDGDKELDSLEAFGASETIALIMPEEESEENEVEPTPGDEQDNQDELDGVEEDEEEEDPNVYITVTINMSY